MRRLRPWILVAGLMIVTACLAVLMGTASEYGRLFLPPGWLAPPTGVGFVAVRSNTSPRLISYRSYAEIRDALPSDVRMARAGLLSTVVEGWTGESRVAVADVDFVLVMRLRVLEGRGLSRADEAAGGGPVCVVTRSFAAAGPRRTVVGQDLRFSTGNCLVAGVVDDDALTYWLPGVSVVSAWNGGGRRLDPRLAGLEDYGILDVLCFPPSGVSVAAMSQRLESLTAHSQFDQVFCASVPAFLFPSRLLSAGRAAAIGAVIALVLAMLSAIVLAFLDATTSQRELWIKGMLGETPLGSFRRGFMREWLRAVGISCVVATGAVACVRGTGSHMVTLSELTAAVGICVVVATGYAAFALTVKALFIGWMRNRPVGTLAAPFRGPARCSWVLQVVSVALLVAAFAYQGAFFALVTTPLGIAADQIQVMETGLPERAEVRTVSGDILAVLDRVARVRGVRAVTVMTTNPVADPGYTSTLAIESQKRQVLNGRRRDGTYDVTPGVKVVGPDFARCVRARILAGRDIGRDDVPSVTFLSGAPESAASA